MSFILITLGAVIGAAALVTFTMYVVHIVLLFFMKLKAKRELTKINDKEYRKVEWKDAGEQEINYKEVQEDERRKFDKFREYEKLRRLKAREREVKLDGAIASRDRGQQERRDLQNKIVELTNSDRETTREPERTNEKTVRFD